VKEFYDISEEGQKPQGRFQLTNYGSERHLMTVGTPVRRGAWGESTEYVSNTTYRATVPEDYLKDFVYMIRKFKPIYEIDQLLDHHLDMYMRKGNKSEIFLKHIRYEVIPLLGKSNDTNPHIELVNKWLGQREGKSVSNHPTPTVHFEGITGNIQLLIDSPYGSQKQEVHCDKADIDGFLSALFKDIESLKHDLKDELVSEVQTALLQNKRGKLTQAKLMNLISLMKEIGVGVFTNVVASPIFEALKPSLGIS
tara:strand:- start:1555 stop:2313 length:759 start_codon:yes stop_codon:yes gene_type:complete